MGHLRKRMTKGLFSICLAWGLLFAGVSSGQQETPLAVARQLDWLHQRVQGLMEDSTATAISLSAEALLLATRSDNRLHKGLAHLNLANGYLYADFYDEALHHASDALQILKKSGSKDDIAAAYSTIGWIYYDSENSDAAMEMHQQALALFRQSGNSDKVSALINGIGLIHAQSGHFEQALPFFEESLQLSRQLQAPKRVAATLNNIGMCKTALGHFEQAIGVLNEALAIATKLDIPLLLAEIFNQRGHTHLGMGALAEADADLATARRFIESSASNARKEKLLDNHEFNTQLQARRGDYKAAYRLQDEYIKLRNDILSEEKSRKLADKRLWYEIQLRESEIKVLEQEKNLQNWQRNALAVGFLLLCIIAFLVYSRMRNDRRKEHQLARMREQLMKKELEREALEKEALNRKVLFKNGELTNFALDLSQKNELLRATDEALNDIESKAPKEIAARLRLISAQINHGLDINREAEVFHSHMEEEHKDFFFNLLQKFPNLTKNEKRLCAQIRLELSCKDIASLNNISVRSVEMARYRLRKTLGLPADASLSEFLKQI